MADELLLDDPRALDAADPAGVLRAVAGSGGHVRAAQALLDTDLVAAVAGDGRPRAVVLVAHGDAGSVADLVIAVIGPRAPVPLIHLTGHSLPGWVGPLDLVIAVSASGTTPETVAVTDEALRRGARVVAVAPVASDLAQRVGAGRSRAVLATDTAGRLSRTGLWTLVVPLLAVVDQLALAEVSPGIVAGAADVLDGMALAYGPVVDFGDNRAKEIGLALAESTPMVWGTGDVGAAAARRLALSLAQNAHLPALPAAIPDAFHHYLACVDGPLAGGSPGGLTDIFRDRGEADAERGLRLFLLRDSEEHPRDGARTDNARRVAESRGVPVDVVTSVTGHALLRAASLLALADFASVYAGLASGVDPGAIPDVSLWVSDRREW